MGWLCVIVAHHLLRQHRFGRWRLPLPIDVHRLELLVAMRTATAGRQTSAAPWRPTLSPALTSATASDAATATATVGDDAVHPLRYASYCRKLDIFNRKP